MVGARQHRRDAARRREGGSTGTSASGAAQPGGRRVGRPGRGLRLADPGADRGDARGGRPLPQPLRPGPTRRRWPRATSPWSATPPIRCSRSWDRGHAARSRTRSRSPSPSRPATDIESALAGYDADRVPRAKGLVKGSRAAARSRSLPAALARTLRNATLGVAPAAIRIRQLDRVIEGWPHRPRSAERPAFVYLLRCGDSSLYCGWTFDVEKRLEAHRAGRGARGTRARTCRWRSRRCSRCPTSRAPAARRRGSRPSRATRSSTLIRIAAR